MNFSQVAEWTQAHWPSLVHCLQVMARGGGISVPNDLCEVPTLFDSRRQRVSRLSPTAIDVLKNNKLLIERDPSECGLEIVYRLTADGERWVRRYIATPSGA